MTSVASSWVILPAAGRGSRMGLDIPKQFLPIHGVPVIEHTLRALLAHPRIAGAVIALNPASHAWHAPQDMYGKPVLLAEGGAERADSVHSALQRLGPQVAAADWVLVHDAARPNLQHSDLDALFTALDRGDIDGALLAARVADTIKRQDSAQRVAETVPREGLWRALTPQAFRHADLLHALTQAAAAGLAVTDETMAMEQRGIFARLVEGRADNLKITTQSDLALAEFLLDRTPQLSHKGTP